MQQAILWCGPGSNRRHKDFQSFALPTELPHHFNFQFFSAIRRIPHHFNFQFFSAIRRIPQYFNFQFFSAEADTAVFSLSGQQK